MFKAKQKLWSLLVAGVAMLCAMVFGFATLFAPTPVTTASAATVTVTDTLTRATTGIATNSSNYANWSGKKSESTAVYAGHSAGSYDSIQLRSKNNNSGIVTTASGGKAIKITIDWQSNTREGRTLDFYGKNSPYSQATDLYSTSTQGTKIGSIVCGTSTELTIDEDYTYIGLKANDALYVTSVTIEWEVEVGGCDVCDYSDGYTYTSNPGGVEDNATHTKAGTCTVCGTEQIFDKTEKCTFDEGVVTPPTTTENGYTTYTCVCGYSYTGNEVPALSATKYTLSFSVPAGVSSIPSEQVPENINFELPTVEDYLGYTFIGWVTEKCNVTEVKPSTIYSSTIAIEEDTTLYALYAYIEDTKLVKNVSELAVGQEIIIAASGYNFALSTTQNTNNRGQAAIKKGSNILTEFGSNVQIIKLEAGTKANTFAFNVGSGYLYAASSSKNYLKTGTKNDNASWAISITSAGVATIKAQGTYTNNWLRYNNQSSLFSCYASGQQDVSIYIKGSTSYTTVFPSIDSASVTIGESLKLNYKATLSDAFAGAVMYFDFDGETYDVAGVKEDGKYVFSLEVPPHAMAVNVKAELKLDDVVLDSIENYSIQTYAQNKLNAADSSDALKQLLTDMLYYGDAAYNYAHKTTGTPITSGVENLGTQSTVTPVEADNVFALVSEEMDSYPVYFVKANVEFGDVNNIRVTLSTFDANVALFVNDEEVDLDSALYTTEGILATKLGTTYTFKLYYDGELIQTLTYSVNAYIYRMQTNENIGALALALYNYGKSAEAYKA